MRHLPVAVLFMLAMSCAADPVLETSHQPIVNGELTADFPSVGTLTRNLPGSNSGTYCSGTLVAPQWVLTAGHCLDVINGLDLEPVLLTFYLGEKLTLPAQGPDDGFQGHYFADARFLHPEFNPFFLFHDVGLLHLSQPVVGVKAYPLRTESLDDSPLGTDVTFVGFGKLGMSMGGTGTKRVTTMPTKEIQAHYFVSDYQGSGVCEGDSGGPGFLPAGDGFEMAGVVSGLVGGTPDICHSDAVASRVDYYASWVQGHLDGPGPHCQEEPDMCLCPAGCTATGPCDNTLCALDGCLSLGACLTDCEGGLACTMRCRRRDETGLLATWSALTGCGQVCDGDLECLAKECPEEYESCRQSAATDRMCPELLTCLDTCQGPACEADCLSQGTDIEQGLVEALIDCDGEVCDDLQMICDSDARCSDDADCPPDEACGSLPAYPLAWICGCRDDDGDLWCATEECDDSNELVNPDASELCFDDLDNDCDGEVDEDCASPAEPEPSADLIAGPEAFGAEDVLSPEDVAAVADSLVEADPEFTARQSDGCSMGTTPSPSGWLLLLALFAIPLLRRCYT